MTDSTKATRAQVTIGSLTVDGFMLPDGSYRMSQSQAAEAVGLSRRNVFEFLRSKTVKALLGDSFAGSILPSEEVEIESDPGQRGATRFTAMPLVAVIAYWHWQSHRGNKTALALCIALSLETLERRFDAAFNISRSEQEYNQILTERMQLAADLQRLGEAYAADDVLRAENERLIKRLRELGEDPYGPSSSNETEQ